jgi:outer membrane protein assembly factor BamD
MDDVLVGLGDAYETEARYVRTLKLPEAGKARLEKNYDDLAIAAYRTVVTEHAASPHVEDARDRLAAMNVPIPAPTPEQMAASAALENSRRQYRLQDRLSLLILHKPDVVAAATNGEPPLTDAKPTLAPQVYKQITADFANALNPNAPLTKPAAAETPAANAGASAPATDAAAPAAPLAFQEVPAAAAGDNNGSSVMTNAPGSSAPAARMGGATNSMGVEIISPSGAATPVDTGGLKSVGPVNSAPLPAVEKVGMAPDAVNDIPAGAAPAAQAPNANGKNGKPEFDKGDESSSKHKKKKGLKKVNPF